MVKKYIWKFSPNLLSAVQDNLIGLKIAKMSSQSLIKDVLSYIKHSHCRFFFVNFKDTRQLGEYFNEPSDEIHIASRARVDCVVGIVVHECLHAIFPQINSEHRVLKLERRLLRAMTVKQADKILHEVFNGRWRYTGRFIKVIYSVYDQEQPRKSKKEKRVRS